MRSPISPLKYFFILSRARRIRSLRITRLMCAAFKAIKEKEDLFDNETGISDLSYSFALSILRINKLKVRRANALLAIRYLRRHRMISVSEALATTDKIDQQFREELEYVLF